MSFFIRLNDFVQKIFGSTQILTHEKICIEAWKNTLSEENQSIFDAQKKFIYLVQRSALGAKVCFFCKKNSPRIFNQNHPLKVATVYLQDQFFHEFRCSLYCVHGQLFSLEFPKSLERYAQKKQIDIASLKFHRIEVLYKL